MNPPLLLATLDGCAPVALPFLLILGGLVPVWISRTLEVNPDSR